MRVAGELLGQNTIVIVDDVQRNDEKALAEAIAKAFGLSPLVIPARLPLDYGRRACVLRPNGVVKSAKIGYL